MKRFIIIPARMDSKRLPGKVLLPIQGKPIILHVVSQASQVPDVEEVIVATDDMGIQKVVHDFGFRALLTSKEHINGTERTAEAARKIGISLEDTVLNIQADIPFVDPEVCNIVLMKSEHSLNTVIVKGRGNSIFDPDQVKVVIDKYSRSLYFSRCAIPNANTDYWWKHLGIYGMPNWLLQTYSKLKPSELEMVEGLEQLRFLYAGIPIHVHITNKDCLSINNIKDYEQLTCQDIDWPANQVLGHVI